MGLFSSSSKTYVSSVTYPLGDDDPAKRVDFAKYVVLNSILQDVNISRSLTSAYMGGGGMNLKRTFNYARDKYTQGLPEGGMLYAESPDRTVVTNILETLEPGAQVYLSTATVAIADFTFWAERYLAQTYGYDRTTLTFTQPPDGVAATAVVSYDVERTGAIRILFMNPNNTSKILTYYPKDLQSQALYLHSVYQIVRNFPTEVTTTTRPSEAGDTAGVTTTNVLVERASEIQQTITKTTITISGGNTTTEVEKKVSSMSRPKYFLYRLGSGTYPTLDALRNTTGPGSITSPFYPAIPLRIDNVDYTSAAYSSKPLYETSEALLKQMGVSLGDIATNLMSNASINEIDFAFIQFGVALNSRTPECKKYIYEFLEMLSSLTAFSKAEFDAWETAHVMTIANMQADGGDPAAAGTQVPTDFGGSTGGIDDYGFGSPPTNILKIFDPSFGERTKALDIFLQWQWIDTTQHAGVISATAKPGDVLVGTSGSADLMELLGGMVLDKSIFFAVRQIDEGTYEKITISGLTHTNNVYKDKQVIITAFDAMNVATEEGFILPLSRQVLDVMSMKDVTQMSYDCMHLVLNSYQVVKKKWYQTGIFKVLLIIVAIVLTVLAVAVPSPASAAFIKTAAGIVSILGVSGLVAVFILATVTVVAGMVLTKVLTPVFINAFGEKWGRVLAVIAVALTMNYASTGKLLGNLLTTPLTATKLIQGSISVTNLYSQYLTGSMIELDVNGKMKVMQEDYDKRMDEIQKLSDELLGSTALIDIQGFLDKNEYQESPLVFLSRTLMTGSDVAEITFGQISGMAEVGLQLPNTG